MTFTEKWLNNFIDGIEARAAPPKADDYLGKDGLIYCSKCNTPKQCRIELFKKEKPNKPGNNKPGNNKPGNNKPGNNKPGAGNK